MIDLRSHTDLTRAAPEVRAGVRCGRALRRAACDVEQRSDLGHTDRLRLGLPRSRGSDFAQPGTRPILPLLPSTPARRTHDYKRNPTTDLLSALDVATGRVHTQMYSRHPTVEFKKFLGQLDREVPAQLDVHLILDNYSTHKPPEIHRWLLRHLTDQHRSEPVA